MADASSNLTMSTGLQGLGGVSSQLASALQQQTATGGVGSSTMTAGGADGKGLPMSPQLAGATGSPEALSMANELSTPSELNPSGNANVGMAEWGAFLPPGSQPYQSGSTGSIIASQQAAQQPTTTNADQSGLNAQQQLSAALMNKQTAASGASLG